MSKTVKIDDLADEVMKGLTEYSNLATADMKKAVRKAGNDVRKEIQDTAPKKDGCLCEKLGGQKDKGIFRKAGSHCSLQKPLSAGTSFGVWSCQAWRRQNQGTASHCTCGGTRHHGT